MISIFCVFRVFRRQRRHAVSIGYDANYSILDSEDAGEMLNVCVDEAAIDTPAAFDTPLMLDSFGTKEFIN